jgi:hypothetical protein
VACRYGRPPKPPTRAPRDGGFVTSTPKAALA